MAGQNDAKLRKNLPKRAMNVNRRAKRKACWEAAQRRKKANIEANHKAWLVNEQYRDRGEPTPYEARQRARKRGPQGT